MKEDISSSEVKRCLEEKGLFCWGCGQVAYTPFDGHYKRMVK